MKALRFYDRRDIRIEDLPPPSPKKDEVLIKVTDAGLSQTQLNEFVEGPFIINKVPHPLTQKAAPLIPCQEYGGIVEAVGDERYKDLIGKQVAILPLLSCGECDYCKNHQEQLCSKLAYYGLLGADGGFAQYSVVKAANIFEVQKRSLLTFIEPILVGIHAANQIKKITDPKAKRILVLGAGAVGVSVAAVLEGYFKASVTVNDILQARLKRANKAGVKIATEDELSKDFDIVVDAAGMDTLSFSPALIEALNYLKRGGIVLNIGTYFHSVSFIPSSLLVKEQLLFSSFTYNSADLSLLPQVIESLDIDFPILIDSIGLDEIIEDGYYRAEVDKESFTRLLVRPWND